MNTCRTCDAPLPNRIPGVRGPLRQKCDDCLAEQERERFRRRRERRRAGEEPKPAQKRQRNRTSDALYASYSVAGAGRKAIDRLTPNARPGAFWGPI